MSLFSALHYISILWVPFLSNFISPLFIAFLLFLSLTVITSFYLSINLFIYLVCLHLAVLVSATLLSLSRLSLFPRFSYCILYGFSPYILSLIHVFLLCPSPVFYLALLAFSIISCNRSFIHALAFCLLNWYILPFSLPFSSSSFSLSSLT